jgi:serine-type D-Ala-D-Ala carboxypeptidase/endopeptidase (penicillin-binding protein 4)
MKKIIALLLSLILCSYAKSSRDLIVDLQSKIERLLLGYEESAHIGVEVISLKNGQILYRKASDKLFVPASTLKIFTAAAALDLLGVDYRFDTEVYVESLPKEGTIHGNLYLRGSGDPSLSIEDLRQLASQLVLKGVKKIEGNFIVDNSEFDAVPLGPGWMWDEGAEYWNSPMDALTVNHSCIDVWVEPGKIIGSPAKITLIPALDYITTRNRAKTVEGKSTLKVKRSWLTKENLIEVEGNISLQSAPVRYRISIEDPAHYAGTIFQDLLKNEGILLTGGLEKAKTPSWAQSIAIHHSLPLRYLVSVMMKDSDNLYANCFFKKIGAKSLGLPGNWLKGSQAMRNFLQRKAGLDISDLVILDGSGESRYNLISPHQEVQFLIWAQKQFSFFPEWLSSFAIAGVDGTLRDRMTAPELLGKVRAKPGTMTGVTGLVGVVEAKDGEILAFSILSNGFVKSGELLRSQLEDQLVAILANFSKE